jgi:curli production assembly/transport component CsgF
MMKNWAKISFVNISAVSALALLSSANIASSQGMSFQFTNPTFGGNSFNSSHLLALADIQNRYVDDGSGSDSLDSQDDQFVRQLQSRLLSSLSSSLSDVITGAEVNESDVITIGDQEIEYSRGLDNIVVIIRDLLTGSETKIDLPVIDSTESSS